MPRDRRICFCCWWKYSDLYVDKQSCMYTNRVYISYSAKQQVLIQCSTVDQILATFSGTGWDPHTCSGPQVLLFWEGVHLLNKIVQQMLFACNAQHLQPPGPPPAPVNLLPCLKFKLDFCSYFNLNRYQHAVITSSLHGFHNLIKVKYIIVTFILHTQYIVL